MTSPRRNTSLALSLCAVVLGMVMLVAASVPLYRLFCQATGFGGVAERTKLAAPQAAGSRVITVQFDANVNPGLDWSFRPAQREVSVHVGEETRIDYIATSRVNYGTEGTATFNISPPKAGGYFNKIQCFCFTKQHLLPHETKRLSVTFFIDPAINDNRDLDDIRTIILSYTFFRVE